MSVIERSLESVPLIRKSEHNQSDEISTIVTSSGTTLVRLKSNGTLWLTEDAQVLETGQILEKQT